MTSAIATRETVTSREAPTAPQPARRNRTLVTSVCTKTLVAIVCVLSARGSARRSRRLYDSTRALHGSRLHKKIFAILIVLPRKVRPTELAASAVYGLAAQLLRSSGHYHVSDPHNAPGSSRICFADQTKRAVGQGGIALNGTTWSHSFA